MSMYYSLQESGLHKVNQSVQHLQIFSLILLIFSYFHIKATHEVHIMGTLLIKWTWKFWQ